VKQVAEGVWVVTAGAFRSNSYIVAADVPGGAILVDAGLDAAPIDAAFRALDLRPAHLFCTHGHFDHVGSASHFQNAYGARVHLHSADAKTAKMGNFLLTAMKLPDRIELPDFTLVEDCFEIALGGETLRYLHAPGHSPGSCVLSFGDNLFVGDTLYARGIGLSKLPGERPDQLRASIAGLWDRLDGFTVHPGHGPSAAGAAIKRDNAALRDFLGLAAEPRNASARG